MMKSILALILSLAGLCWHADALALSCGDTVTGNTTLTADLSCTSGGYALYVATPGVTIDFNGYSLRGSASMDGIRIANASDVTLLYGNLSGFRVGVNASRADRLTVSGMLLWDLGSAVIASDSRAVSLVGNTAYLLESWGFFLPAYAGSRPSLGGHNIVGNWLEGPATLIGVCGAANGGSLVRGNEMHGGGVLLMDGASGNEVSGNIMEGNLSRDFGILLFGSRDNLVRDNGIHRYENGIALIPAYNGKCATGPLPMPQVNGNRILDNDLSIGLSAILLGRGDSRRPLVFGNLVSGNSIAAFDLGLHLRADSFDNVASGNLFFYTTRPVRDEGALNSVSGIPFVRRSGGSSRISVKPSSGVSSVSRTQVRNLAGRSASGKVRAGVPARYTGYSRPVR
jgi:parallel beta-helix repeat protein